jgi:type IV pilus assembly protein PilP
MKKIALFIVASTCLFGCELETLNELESFVSTINVESKSNVRLEKLPDFSSELQMYTYSSGSLRSPFRKELQQESDGENSTGIKPDESRAKQYLEQFNTAELEYVGSLSKQNKIWSLIKDLDGKIHQVPIGDYMGKYSGRISQIKSDYIEVVEIVPNGINSWIKSTKKIKLREASKKDDEV